MSMWKLCAALAAGAKVLPGDVAFKLHDTYGFPLDLTNDVCRERGVSVDEAGFDAAMEQQKAKGRAAGKFKMDKALEYTGAGNNFTGYEHLEESAAKVVALYLDGVAVAELRAGQSGVVVLDVTPFYAESGGQVGDEGVLTSGSARFEVADTQKIKADVFGHHGVLASGALKVGDAVTAKVNMALRTATQRNHSVTHLMHKALREVLGSHVQQKGSLVDAEKTRFDFAHNAPVTDAEIREIERRVNEEILANAATQARVMDIESAQKTGAMMLFGEKYGDRVRVIKLGTSVELCGGTHVSRTGDIGLLQIISETGIAKGVRRIEAVTAEGAEALIAQREAQLTEAAELLRAGSTEVVERVTRLLEDLKGKDKEIAALQKKLAASGSSGGLAEEKQVGDLKVVIRRIDGTDPKALREVAESLQGQLHASVLALGSALDGKVSLVVAVDKALANAGKAHAGKLVGSLAALVGGKGGGRPDIAQAGGSDPEKLDEALRSVFGLI